MFCWIKCFISVWINNNQTVWKFNRCFNAFSKPNWNCFRQNKPVYNNWNIVFFVFFKLNFFVKCVYFSINFNSDITFFSKIFKKVFVFTFFATNYRCNDHKFWTTLAIKHTFYNLVNRNWIDWYVAVHAIRNTNVSK